MTFRGQGPCLRKEKLWEKRLLLDGPSVGRDIWEVVGTEAEGISLLCDAGEMLIGIILAHYGLESGELMGSDLNGFLDHVLVCSEE